MGIMEIEAIRRDYNTLAAEVASRLLAGDPPDQVARTAELEVGMVDGIPAVVLPGYVAMERGGEAVYCPDAEDAEAAGQWYIDTSDYPPDVSTYWVDVAVWRVGIRVEDGDIIVRQVDGSRVMCRSRIDPEEPPCSSEEGHEWQAPHEVVGGIKENPGCWGHGGGVVLMEVCAHCGVYRRTDTWATDPETGGQGLRAVEYLPADERSRRWVEEVVA